MLRTTKNLINLSKNENKSLFKFPTKFLIQQSFPIKNRTKEKAKKLMPIKPTKPRNLKISRNRLKKLKKKSLKSPENPEIMLKEKIKVNTLVGKHPKAIA